MSIPSFGAVTHAVGHVTMPFDECLAKIALADGKHILLLTSSAGPALEAPASPASSQFPNAVASSPAELNRRAAAAGLKISCLYAGGLTDVSTDSATGASIAALIPHRNCARKIGCRSLVISGYPAERPLMPLAAKRVRIHRLARLMDGVAEGCGDTLSISVDLHYGTIIETLDDARCLADASRRPEVGIVLNIGHLTTAAQEGWRLVGEMPERLPVVAWKDHSLASDRPSSVYSIELGTGDSPFENYVSAFKSLNGSAPEPVHLVNVEHSPVGREVQVLTRSITYMQELWRRTQP